MVLREKGNRVRGRRFATICCNMMKNPLPSSAEKCFDRELFCGRRSESLSMEEVKTLYTDRPASGPHRVCRSDLQKCNDLLPIDTDRIFLDWTLEARFKAA